MNYSKASRPELYCILQDGWAVFKGGYKAHCARWHEYCQRYTDDFEVYEVPSRTETMERVDDWLTTGKVVASMLPLPDARSIELGRLEYDAAMKRFQQAQLAVEQANRADTPIETQQRKRAEGWAINRTRPDGQEE